jgi:hypothetical protein
MPPEQLALGAFVSAIKHATSQFIADVPGIDVNSASIQRQMIRCPANQPADPHTIAKQPLRRFGFPAPKSAADGASQGLENARTYLYLRM